MEEECLWQPNREKKPEIENIMWTMWQTLENDIIFNNLKTSRIFGPCNFN